MDRRFKLHQVVRLMNSGTIFGHVSPDGLYEVKALLPQDQAGDFSYLLRSPAGDRVARENQIADETST